MKVLFFSFILCVFMPMASANLAAEPDDLMPCPKVDAELSVDHGDYAENCTLKGSTITIRNNVSLPKVRIPMASLVTINGSAANLSRAKITTTRLTIKNSEDVILSDAKITAASVCFVSKNGQSDFSGATIHGEATNVSKSFFDKSLASVDFESYNNDRACL